MRIAALAGSLACAAPPGDDPTLPTTPQPYSYFSYYDPAWASVGAELTRFLGNGRGDYILPWKRRSISSMKR